MSNPHKKPFSLSLSSSSQPKKSANSTAPPSSSKNHSLPRRPHNQHLNHGDDSASEDESVPAHETVTGFDTHTGAALAEDGAEINKEKSQMVIPVDSGNNWRNRPGVNTARGKKNLLPKEVQAIREAEARGQTAEDAAGGPEAEGPSMKYGISYAPPLEKGDGDLDMKDAGRVADNREERDQRQQQKPRTEDEIALQALLRETNGEQPQSDLVIETAKRGDGDEGEDARYDETTSFRADVQTRPESASLDQYNAIPVEEFGAALLRGMGWKDGQAIGRGNYGTSATADHAIRPRMPERRPGFLGIGAKDVSGGKGAEMELGAWGKSAMRKGARKAGQEGNGNTEGVYMPVMMKNKQTGEYITEEELAAMQKEAKARKVDGDDEWKGRRDRNLEKSGRDRDRDQDREYRRRDYDEDYSSRRKNVSWSSRRDRSLSSDRHSRSRRYDNEGLDRRKDDRHYRDKERDRDRGSDRERRRDRDRSKDRSHRYRDDDRHSSRHSSSHTSSRRDRDRDRSRDRDSYRRWRDDR